MMLRLLLTTSSIDGMFNADDGSSDILAVGRNLDRTALSLPFSVEDSAFVASPETRLRWPSKSQFRSTAMTISAPMARHSETGTGLTRPPSTSIRPSFRTGVNRPGIAIEARTASTTPPSRSHISRPLARSVATQENAFGNSSIRWSSSCLRRKETSLPPSISPPSILTSSNPTTACQLKLAAQCSKLSSFPAA